MPSYKLDIIPGSMNKKVSRNRHNPCLHGANSLLGKKHIQLRITEVILTSKLKRKERYLCMVLQKPIMGGFDHIREIKDTFSGRNVARTEVMMSGNQPVKEGRKSIRLWKKQIPRGGRQDRE